jgi:hypothetical protein
LFWRTDELGWTTDGGRRTTLKLLGRRGAGPGARLANFREQSGLYILYKKSRVYYVGVVWGDRLGNRLRDHLEDIHEGKWDRFSWFGFRKVVNQRDRNGWSLLGPSVRRSMSMHGLRPSAAIRDIEAAFIRALGLSSSQKKPGFTKAYEWVQVTENEPDFVSELKRKQRPVRARKGS